MRKLALTFLLLPGTAAAEQPALLCAPTSEVHCEGSACVTLETSAMEVSFQPEPTPLEECRALRCESAPPRIALCDLAICGWGTVHYNWHDPDSDGVFRTGIAYIAPDPPPRLYASMHFALAYDASSGRLALSRFDGNSLETVWLDCRPQ